MQMSLSESPWEKGLSNSLCRLHVCMLVLVAEPQQPCSNLFARWYVNKYTYLHVIILAMYASVPNRKSLENTAAMQPLSLKCLRKVCAQFERTTAAVVPDRSLDCFVSGLSALNCFSVRRPLQYFGLF